MLRSLERSFSKKSMYPSCTFSGVVGFSFGSSSAGKKGGLRGIGGAGGSWIAPSAPAEGAVSWATACVPPSESDKRSAIPVPSRIVHSISVGGRKLRFRSGGVNNQLG